MLFFVAIECRNFGNFLKLNVAQTRRVATVLSKSTVKRKINRIHLILFTEEDNLNRQLSINNIVINKKHSTKILQTLLQLYKVFNFVVKSVEIANRVLER